MSSRWLVLSLASLSVAACATPPAPLVATVASPATARRAPVSDEPLAAVEDRSGLETRFPAGPGVELDYEELQRVTGDSIARDPRLPYPDRVMRARELLGAKGEETDEGTRFLGVTGRNVAGPYACSALVVAKRGGVSLGPTDRRLCGLPYATKLLGYSGPGPFIARSRLAALHAQIASLSPAEARAVAEKRLPIPDMLGDAAVTWHAIGARSATAPISCHALRIGEKVTLEERPLAECGLSWPPPVSQFDPGPPVKPALVADALDVCRSRCGASEVCTIEREIPLMASVVATQGEVKARFIDGRPAQVKLEARCAPLPSTCSSADRACFAVPPPPAPVTQPRTAPQPPPRFAPTVCSDKARGGAFEVRDGLPVVWCYVSSKTDAHVQLFPPAPSPILQTALTPEELRALVGVAGYGRAF